MIFMTKENNFVKKIVENIFMDKMNIKKTRADIAVLLMILVIIFWGINLVGCGAKTDKEPIIGEWEFKHLVIDGDVITSEELEELGYEDNAGMYFSCQEKEYSLGLPSNTVMSDEWQVDTNEAFTEKYAHTYLLDEDGGMRAVFEKEEDLDTLWIFISADNDTQLMVFTRSEK